MFCCLVVLINNMSIISETSNSGEGLSIVRNQLTEICSVDKYVRACENEGKV